MLVSLSRRYSKTNALDFLSIKLELSNYDDEEKDEEDESPIVNLGIHSLKKINYNKLQTKDFISQKKRGLIQLKANT